MSVPYSSDRCFQLTIFIAFHVGLIVFSALQVHEARSALVFLHDDPCTSFLVS